MVKGNINKEMNELWSNMTKEHTKLEEHHQLYKTLEKLKKVDEIASNDITAKLVRLYRQYGYDGYGWNMDKWYHGEPINDVQELRSKLKSLNDLAEAAELQARLDLKERNKIQMRAKEAELEEEDYQNRLYSNKIDRKKKSAKAKSKRKVIKKCKCK
jgi:hypothetical protein